MIIQEYLTQPLNDSEYRSLFGLAVDNGTLAQWDAAVAYATNSGVEVLVAVLKKAADWKHLRKRWLVGIDWCRSEPLALERLASLSQSAVRVFDGARVVKRRQCVPILPFHPKAFMLHSNDARCVISGSGNLSRNGLTRGHEVGSILAAVSPSGDEEQRVWNSCGKVISWFEQLWRTASPIGNVLQEYRRQYERSSQLIAPTPTDEDIAPLSADRPRGLSAERLQQLRVCRFFWIEAGNLHANRGPGQPGNQLMLSRNMRVFFGFPAQDLATDTNIGDVSILCNGMRRDDCSMRFSNNSMDVLTLPVPGTQGPAKYDQQTLLFEKTSNRSGLRFELKLASAGDKGRWKARSKPVGGPFQMTSGREWGVF